MKKGNEGKSLQLFLFEKLVNFKAENGVRDQPCQFFLSRFKLTKSKVQGSRFKVQGSFISHYLYKANMERKVRLQHMITR